MADTKISALPASTTPLAGTEVLPIVQSGVTKHVSVNNLTAGKNVPVNAVIFPATQAPSADPNTLNDYEEGTWTVVWTNLTGTPGSTTGYYTKIGRVVTFSYATGAGAISGTAGNVRFTLPFTPAQKSAGQSIAEGPGNANVNWINTDGLCYPIGFSAAFMIFSGTYIV